MICLEQFGVGGASRRFILNLIQLIKGPVSDLSFAPLFEHSTPMSVQRLSAPMRCRDSRR